MLDLLNQLEAHGVELLSSLIITCFVFLLRKFGINKAQKHAEAFAPLIKEAINIGLRSTKNKIITNDTELSEAVTAVVKSMPLPIQALAPMAAKRAATEAILAVKPTKENTKRIQSLGIDAVVDGKTIGAGIKAGFKRGVLTVSADSKGKAVAGFTLKF